MVSCVIKFFFSILIFLFLLWSWNFRVSLLRSIFHNNWYQSLDRYFGMTAPKFEIEKFNYQNSFRLWWIKIYALLRQQGVTKILDGKMSSTSSSGEITILREVAYEKTVSGIMNGLYFLQSSTVTSFVVSSAFTP